MTYPALDRFERLSQNLDRFQKQLSAHVTQIQEEPVEVTGESGLTSVRVDHSGRIQEISLDPRAMRLPSFQLAEELTATLAKAQDQAAARLQDAVREVLGSDAPVDGFPG